MSKKRKVGYVLTVLGFGIIGGLGVSRYGDAFLWYFFGAVAMTTMQVVSKYRTERLYWRKQIWRCDTCGSIITPQSEAVITCRLSGSLKRYDTADCMSSGLKEAF